MAKSNAKAAAKKPAKVDQGAMLGELAKDLLAELEFHFGHDAPQLVAKRSWEYDGRGGVLIPELAAVNFLAFLRKERGK